MFINDMKYSSFIVDKMLGKHKTGGVGLYVDIGTIGYFKDLKVTKRKFVALKKRVRGSMTFNVCLESKINFRVG
jgi:hypothetical protein